MTKRNRKGYAVPDGPGDSVLIADFLLDVAYLYESLSEKQGVTQDSFGK